jgi:O-antigen ligase
VRPGDFEGAIEFAFSHENGVLIALLLVMGVSWALWGQDKKQRLIALGAAILASIVLLTIRRRAGLLLGEAGLLLIGMVLLVQNWRRFILLAPIFALGAGLYLNVYWNDPNSLGQPARVFRSVFQEEETSLRDQASDDYRTRERINVWWNIQARPLEGSGFGVAYDKPLPFPDLTDIWPFWPYIPHNTILWLWMKAGLLGFMLFWYVMGTGVTQTARIVRRTKDPWLLTVGVVTLTFFVMLAMFSYIDLGLTSPRLMLLFGAFLGLVTVLQRFLRDEEDASDDIPPEALPA